MTSEVVKGSAHWIHVVKVTDANGKVTYEVFRGSVRIGLPYVDLGPAAIAMDDATQRAAQEARAAVPPSPATQAPKGKASP